MMEKEDIINHISSVISAHERLFEKCESAMEIDVVLDSFVMSLDGARTCLSNEMDRENQLAEGPKKRLKK